MSVICLQCDGWGCTRCVLERAEAAGGEQGPTAEELELQQLRAELTALKARHEADLEAVADAMFAVVEERLALLRELEQLRLALAGRGAA